MRSHVFVPKFSQVLIFKKQTAGRVLVTCSLADEFANLGSSSLSFLIRLGVDTPKQGKVHLQFFRFPRHFSVVYQCHGVKELNGLSP